MLLTIIFTVLTVFFGYVACICAIAACLCYSAPPSRVHNVKDVSSYSVDTTITGSDTTYVIKYVK